ncbi:hypothetical protein VCCP103710_1909, partial [Vibrio cholerae CP1037(10)]
MAANSVAR